MKHLINASKSRRGWSFYADLFKCPRLWAYKHIAKIQLQDAGPLLRGSMGHVGMAHFLARSGVRQNSGFIYNDETIDDPDYFYDPFEAMELWGKENNAERFLDICTTTIDRWIKDFGSSIDSVVEVEKEFEGILGTNGSISSPSFGKWGLWVLKEYSEEDNTFISYDGSSIIPTLLEVDGSIDDGKPVWLTRRFDAIMKSRKDGSIFIDDHKITAADTSAHREQEYRLDGQFSAVRIFGKQIYSSNFSSARLNLVSCMDPYKSRLHTLKPTQLDRSFADDVWQKVNKMARDQVELKNAFDWEAARNEGICAGRYGLCEGYNLCYQGESAVVNGRALKPAW